MLMFCFLYDAVCWSNTNTSLKTNLSRGKKQQDKEYVYVKYDGIWLQVEQVAVRVVVFWLNDDFTTTRRDHKRDRRSTKKNLPNVTITTRMKVFVLNC